MVGLDGSPASWDAFCWAAGQATRARGSLIAVYVTSAVAPVPVPGDFAYAEQAAQEVAAELKARPSSVPPRRACSSPSSGNWAKPCTL